MRGSAVFRTGVAPGGALAGPWVRDPLWRRARAVPSLDLRFADNKSLVDAATGASLVTFTRASTGTFVGSDGVLQTATTNEPRFDHNPTTGESLGLLVEEARTNLLVRSEEFENVAWTPSNVATPTANIAVAPDGTLTADKIITSNGLSSGLVFQTFALSASTTYTFSAYAKAVEWGWTTLQLRGPENVSAGAWFDLTNGSVGTIDAGVSATIQAVGNGWYRCAVTKTTGTGVSTSRQRIYTTNANNVFATGDGTSGILLWGAQLEAGAFPTSYIPTTTATVTRAADVASITGSNFSSWYNQTEGTVFANYAERAFSATHQVASISNGTANERISFAINSSNVLDVGVISGSVDTFGGNTPTLTTQEYKIGFGYKSDNSGVSANGSAITVDSAVTLPTVSQLDVGARAGTSQLLNSTIKRLTFWPIRLGSEILQRITQ